MTLEELEEILGDKQYKMKETIKIIVNFNEVKRNKKGGLILFDGVPLEILKREPPNFTVLVKAASLKWHIKKVRGEK
jgi:hypothetical protein